MLWVMLEYLLEYPVQLYDGEIEVEAWAQPNDICRASKFPGGSPPRLQRGDAPEKEICADSSYSQHGKPETQDPSGGDLQLVVVHGQSVPVIATHCWGLAQGGERLRALFYNPAPICSPLVPLVAELPLQIGLLLAGPRDPGDPAGKRFPSLDTRHKEMAEESYVGVDSDKVFA